LSIFSSLRLLKNAQMQGAPAFAEAATRRQAKSFVGNGLKPFPTMYAALACPVLDTGKDEGNPAKRGTDERF
jgi:hypothetical protein